MHDASPEWWDARGHYQLDPKLPTSSKVWNIAFPRRHVLLRPYIPEGFHLIPGTEGRPFEQRTILLSRNPKHPVIWGWVLAIQQADREIEPLLAPGVMIVFKRFGNENVGFDLPKDPQWPGQRLDIDITHIDNIECVFDPPLVAPPSYL